MDISLLPTEDSWLGRLILNHIGYLSFAFPVFVLFYISKSLPYSSWPDPIRKWVTHLIRAFILDGNHSELASNETSSTISSIPCRSDDYDKPRLIKLLISFFGLQFSYLLWGLLQERIMTHDYDGEKFNNSQFLVFVNRFLAAFIAYVSYRRFCTHGTNTMNRPPLFCFGIISYANCMSTWFQYESLLYISFPVQVIAKSIKTIPVMLVGRLVFGKNYPVRQYILMLLMAFGVALFLSGYQENSPKSGFIKHNKTYATMTTFSGVVLLICYLGFDAFTSNYQKKIFDQYSISFLTMMFYVNLISSVITWASLILNGTFWDCIIFMQDHSLFAVHALATAVCSSMGQLFIFSTIEDFGPVVFTIIMTMRQAFSILLSCLFYGHQLSWFSVLGIHIAFLAIFTHAYLQFKRSKPSGNNIV